MTDREKVIKGLKYCLMLDSPCEDCPYYSYDIQELVDCERNLQQDAISLLKEQEAVEPIYIENSYTRLPVSYCSKCREPIDKYIAGNPCKKTEYCHYCGQAVKW